jgi:acetoin utilization deacetylase AcuC-like enzyme
MYEPWPSHEAAEPKRRIRNLLDASGLLRKLLEIDALMPSQEDLLRVHSAEYLDRLRDASLAGGGEVGPRMFAFKTTWDLTRLAAGGAIAAVNAVLAGSVDNAYALIRPPGHHAVRDQGQGFCYLGNVAIACRWAQANMNVRKIAVVDWDAHHGNGTQAIFYDDPSVLTISLHQDGAYPPDQGTIGENGSGAGFGYSLNIPLPAGSGHEAYLAACDRIVVPAVTKFQPDLIVVACGYDAGNSDHTARMTLHSESFRLMTRKVMAVADEVCGGKMVMIQEGGYNPMAVPFLALAVFEELSGVRTNVLDPFLEPWRNVPGQTLQDYQAAYIDRAQRRAEAIGRI